jgi:hypothetical protein
VYVAIDWGEPVLWGAERNHVHLRLTAVLPPQQRRKPPQGGSRGPLLHPDRGQHARNIKQQLTAVRERHKRRAKIFGIDPDLVVVVIFYRDVSGVDELLERVGLSFLTSSDRQAVFAFSSDTEMNEFLRHLTLFGQGVLPGKKVAHYQELFDTIKEVRLLEPGDILDRDVQREAERRAGELLRLDFMCWCPEHEPDARRRFDETQQAIRNAGGAVLDSSFRYGAGLSLIRADVPSNAVWGLAETNRVRQIMLLPQPLLTRPEVITVAFDELPRILPPLPDAPIVAVIDSGVRSSHPLIAPTLTQALAANEHLTGGEDENGHGTLVASLALYGSLESKLHAKDPLRAVGRLLSIRVLDHKADFPDAELWTEQLADAIELAAAQGARVVNLSLGDRRHPYHPPVPDPVAAMVDELARKHKLVVVVSAGNFPAVDYIGDIDIVSGYPAWLLDHEDAGLFPPAMSALSLTTGALVADEHQGARPDRDSVDVQLIGKSGQPSPATRVGPGIEKMTKPELMAPGGTYAYDTGLDRFAETPYGKVIGAAAVPPDRLFADSMGTSVAAPLVAHAALRVLGRYPKLSANAVRALLLATAESVEPVVEAETDGEVRAVQLRLSGFGRVNAEHAEFSEDYRAVLVAENELEMDHVHLYTVPIPDSFFIDGVKLVRLGFAFDPEVRATRLKYLSSHMSVYVYRGVTAEEVRAKYAVHSDDDKPPEELKKFQCDLQPSDRIRLLGANQAAEKLWQRPWGEKYRGRLVIAVRNTNRWTPPEEKQNYALALTLRTREDLYNKVYEQLCAELPLLTEIRPEIEL